jgi:aspartate/methionine/tyrosine aminotransferase
MTTPNQNGNTTAPTGAVKESTIRMMTRLAQEYNAVNLSQGFPNEAPPRLLKLSLAHAVLSGQSFHGEDPSTFSEEFLVESLSQLLLSASSDTDKDIATQNDSMSSTCDVLNQYSPPMGRPDLRSSIALYYQRFYQYTVSPDDITVTLGATEAFASALRTVGRPGDKCVVLEPFHELYPSQCKIFYLEPVFVTLREDENGTCWKYDPQELEKAMQGARILILNSPHNPTGKVFSREELQHIVQLCIQYDVYLITDEIYEHMCFDHHRHYLIPKEFPEMVNRTLVCNSIGKSASATGWRVGWCLHPSHLSDSYRGIHDQLAVMSPHPMQYATLSYLKLPDSYFDSLAGKYQQRIHTLSDALISAGFEVIVPQGAYYLFVGYTTVPALAGMASMEAAMYMLKTVGVACVPGDNFFGNKSEETMNKYLRFAACRSEEDLAEAIRRIQKLIG